MSQNFGELTQLGIDDDMDDDDDSSRNELCNSPTPIDPLTIPWGRLMKVGSDNTDLHPSNYNSGGGAASSSSNNNPNNSRGGLEMKPRSPARAGSVATRSRSPSVGSDKQHSRGAFDPSCINFLGLKNLLPSDRFNEYVLGRSVKADITAEKLNAPKPVTAEGEQQQQQQHSEPQKKNVKQQQHDFAHASISNRHCRIYCLLNVPETNPHCSSPSTPEMEVFVEDMSGNGTLINGTTLLRKNERRKLHTGDVICLVNPKLLAKRVRSMSERKMYMSQYSFVFVNLYEQEARHGWGAGLGGGKSCTSRGVGDLASPISAKKGGGGGMVNVRATKCHSISAKAGSNAKSDAVQPVEDGLIGKLPVSMNTSLGSFLNNPNLQSSTRRRVEEEYDLRDLLGTGTCGEVRRAIHRRTGDERAVKIISIAGRGVGSGALFSSEKLSAIQAEAEILRSLDHPYVVKLFDVYVSPGKAIYLVMELIRGGDLFDRIVERERYTEVQARRLFRRILTAVHYLHEERGIVHRDLKPENILVVDRQSDVNIKLTDFGVAKNMTSEGLKTFCGTPQYFAPEVLRRHNTVKGAGRYGKEIDCWSIGVILVSGVCYSGVTLLLFRSML